MFEQSQWVWMDGRIVPWREATVHVSAHALHYGTGVFEGIRCYDTAKGPTIFRLDAHLERLYASAHVHGLQIPFDRGEVIRAIDELIQKNGFRSCYIRPICYYGSASLGLLPSKCPVHLNILVWPWSTYLGNIALEKGVRITVSRWKKFHSSMMPTTAKACGQYLNSILAVRDAVAAGYDEALLLDQAGGISEGSGENIFLVKDHKLFTNDERHSILLGVTRDAVLKIARDLGVGVEIRALTVDDLISADEAFFTGTAAEVTPIREVDGRAIGSGTRGPVTEMLQSRFFAVVTGSEPIYKGWLHLVPFVPHGSSAPESSISEGAD